MRTHICLKYSARLGPGRGKLSRARNKRCRSHIQQHAPTLFPKAEWSSLSLNQAEIAHSSGQATPLARLPTWELAVHVEARRDGGTSAHESATASAALGAGASATLGAPAQEGRRVDHHEH